MTVTLKDALLAELDHEMAVTRRLLERLPQEAFGWKPHSRSMSLGRLATHLVEIPRWGVSILQKDGYDLRHADTPPDGEGHVTVASVLDDFDARVADLRKTLVGLSDIELSKPWSLTRGEQLLMTMPRVVAARRFLMNHLIHHRGQLTVYLRLQNVPLPPIYGPTADEPL